MQTSIPFELRGLPGRVDIDYLVNDDPARWGYPVLGLDFLVERSRGCPVVRATVEYPAEGYAAVMGWIQVVDHRAAPAIDSTVLVDVAPQMQAVDAGMPYFAFGVKPAFFDAPSTDDADYEFRAHAFLTASPDALMSPGRRPALWLHLGLSRSLTPSPRSPRSSRLASPSGRGFSPSSKSAIPPGPCSTSTESASGGARRPRRRAGEGEGDQNGIPSSPTTTPAATGS